MYKNVLEDFVVKEAQAQFALLEPEIRERLSLPEVVAFALNQLKPLYATTYSGWMNQRWQAIRDYDEEVAEQVSRAIRLIQILHFDPPDHEVPPLPETELDAKATFLIKLRRLLGEESLRCQDIPKVLEAAIARKRKVTTRLQIESSATPDAGRDMTPEHLVLESYLMKAELGYCNVLEKVVELVAEHLMRKWTPEERKQLDINDVVAYALNRLPPMYAASDISYQNLRQRAITEMSLEITRVVRDALMKIKHVPNVSAPLPLEKLEREVDHVLVELRRILQSPDATWDNLVQAAEEILS